ncbi:MULTISPECIES: DNA topoisomerase III [Bacillaceae]|uniref:DNA topoisomerase 3 n=1 Tax=Alkalicoccobacillus plakortidis TaxID=444060 RepID=A0A9D5DNH2_9BACI|nr:MULTISPECIES: DNA topoisomerase III [Bacillaceae]KQL57176.1 DNA topoisomerase III [Alkalicoccobacillus plakortidis]
MKKKAILAEKPSVGRDIARVLGANQKGNGFFEGKDVIVTWGLGHLVTHADPEHYGEQYKTWRLEELPMLPKRLDLVVIKQTSKQFHTVKKVLNRQDVGEVIIATDAGREGELVARWILAKAHVKKPIKRLWISSVTDKAIKDGFKKLKDGRQYENLFAAAEARAEADWYVGINGTRALTTKHNAQLSCGRVQTPTLAILAAREKAIQSFKPVPYHTLQVSVDAGAMFRWYNQKSGDERIFDEAEAKALKEKIKGKAVAITSVKAKKKFTPAPHLYDLTELQREANKRYGYSAKETLGALQKLYEQHKAVTYPRTDSRFLSSDLVDTFKDRLKAIDVQPFRKTVLEASKLGTQHAKKQMVNDAKVSDHHALIPTEQAPPISAMNDKETKLYYLIVRRFLANFFPASESEQTVVEAEIANETLRTKGERMISLGWRQNEDEDQAKESKLPKLTEGEKLSVNHTELKRGETTPPARFNEATLLTAMEKPAQFMEEKDATISKTLAQAGGIGTVATRADIIEKLFSSFLIEKKGKDLFVTSKGKQLLDLVPEELKSPALTAEWEQRLEKIVQGKEQKSAFIADMKKYAHSVVGQVKADTTKFRHDNKTGEKCPECGKFLLEVNGKKGKMRVCQDRECGYRKNIAMTTNARCPKCKKKLELRGQGDAQVFACVCGHREKKAQFEERRKQSKNKNVSKREVNNYMKKQNKQDDFANSALADQLAKLGLNKEK